MVIERKIPETAREDHPLYGTRSADFLGKVLDPGTVSEIYAQFHPMDEHQTIKLAKSGNLDAINWLTVAYYNRVGAYCLSRTGGDMPTSEDLTQDTFQKAFSALDRYQERQHIPFSSWLFTIASNTVATHFRIKSRMEAQNLDTIPHDSMILYGQVDDPPDKKLISEQELVEVKETIKMLSEAQRLVVEARFGRGLSIAETARLLGKGQGNVRAIQHQAISRLKVLLLSNTDLSPENLQQEVVKNSVRSRVEEGDLVPLTSAPVEIYEHFKSTYRSELIVFNGRLHIKRASLQSNVRLKERPKTKNYPGYIPIRAAARTYSEFSKILNGVKTGKIPGKKINGCWYLEENHKLAL